jgi:hypothetical protein
LTNLLSLGSIIGTISFFWWVDCFLVLLFLFFALIYLNLRLYSCLQHSKRFLGRTNISYVVKHEILDGKNGVNSGKVELAVCMQLKAVLCLSQDPAERSS